MVSTRNSDRRALIFTYRTYYQSFSRLGTRMSQDLSHQSTTKRILSYEHSTCDTCLSVTSGGTWSYDRKLEYSWTRTLQRSWSICSMVHHSFTNMKYVIHMTYLPSRGSVVLCTRTSCFVTHPSGARTCDMRYELIICITCSMTYWSTYYVRPLCLVAASQYRLPVVHCTLVE